MKHNGNILTQTFLTVLALCASIAATPYAGAADLQPEAIKVGDAQLAVVLGTNPSPAEMRVKELLAERIKDRADISLTGSFDQAKFGLVIGTTASNDKIKEFAATHKEVAALGADGYVIAVESGKPELYIAGQNDS